MRQSRDGGDRLDFRAIAAMTSHLHGGRGVATDHERSHICRNPESLTIAHVWAAGATSFLVGSVAAARKRFDISRWDHGSDGVQSHGKR